MGKPKVYIHRAEEWYSRYLCEADIEKLSQYADVVNEKDRKVPLSEEELIERLDGVEIILSLNGLGVQDFTPNVIRAMAKSVRYVYIAHWWNIHNSFVPMCKDAGITVVEGSNMNTVAVAEWTLGAILFGRRRINTFNERLKSGNEWGAPRLCADMVYGSTIGLVGLGRIGRYVAQVVQLLGAKVIAYDMISADAMQAFGIEKVSLEKLFETSDVISLHLPVTQQTTGIIGADLFERIKDDVLFINSARAALCDENAMISALKKNRFTAFLDVFQTEPLPLSSPLRKMDNVIITPHIAGDNRAMFKAAGSDTIDSIIQYLADGKVINKQYETVFHNIENLPRYIQG